MTKYEWETELKRNIHSLPADEVKRVLEYYGELFDEMAERGKSEREIINEFGNPFDVANKILSEYDVELEEKTVVPTPTIEPKAELVEKPQHTVEQKSEDVEPQRSVERKSEAEKPQTDAPTPENAAKIGTARSGEIGRRADPARITLFILFNFFTGGVIFIMIGVVWIMLAALTMGSVALVFGGGVAALSSFAVMSTGHAGAGGAQLGIGVAASGAGILLTVGCIMLILLYCKLNKLIFGGIKKILTVKAV